MVTGVPPLADIRKFAANATVLSGEVELARFDRLRTFLSADAGRASYTLRFGIDAEGIVNVAGEVAAVLPLVCERCREPMGFRVESCFALAWLVSDSLAEHLPERYEPLVSEQGLIETTVIIEDELLLSLPIVSYHQEDECPADSSYVSGDIAAGGGEQNPGPFDALLALKKK